MDHFITKNLSCQVDNIFRKLAMKKQENKFVIDYLQNINEDARASNILHCGEHIGITDVNGVAKIVKADFCRERLCYVCAWRRQAKFISQMYPVIDILQRRGYEFIFVTLTMRNMEYDNLENAINTMLKGYEKLRHLRKVRRGWAGIVRSLELTYNAEDGTFHPHLHLLVAVRPEYFKLNDLYISVEELSFLWKNCINTLYIPIVDIRKVTDTDRATVETLKYALKPSRATQAFDAFFFILKHRRLISFCGVFNSVRNELKYSDFDSVLTDDISVQNNASIVYNLYTFDATGGIYRFTEQFVFQP